MARVVAQDGVRAVTIRAVAAKAGVGMGSLYQFFPTREALLVAWEEDLTWRGFQEGAAEFLELVQSAPGLRAVIDAAVRYVFDAIARIVMAYGPNRPSHGLMRDAQRDKLFAQMQALLVATLRERPGRSLRGDIPVELVARVVVRTIGWLGLDVATTPSEDPERYRVQVADMLYRYLSSTPDQRPL